MTTTTSALTVFPPAPEPATLPLWQDGAPAHGPAAAVEIDRRICKALRCDRCGKRGLVFKPQQSGRRYRVLAVCPACGHENEM
jgi:hypothetical protein